MRFRRVFTAPCNTNETTHLLTARSVSSGKRRSVALALAPPFSRARLDKTALIYRVSRRVRAFTQTSPLRYGRALRSENTSLSYIRARFTSNPRGFSTADADFVAG